MNSPMEKIEHKYLQAVDLIKKAILQSQYNAVRLANQEQLKLYFSIGRYISENSRRGFWGSGALDIISLQLKNDLPGLMGFSVTSLKNMRKFYEAWSELEDKSASTLADFQNADIKAIEIRQAHLLNSVGIHLTEFLAVPFTQHIRIIEGVKERDERLFYILLTSMSHLTEKGVIKAIKEDEYHHRGSLPNNFISTFPDIRSARRAQFVLSRMNTSWISSIQKNWIPVISRMWTKRSWKMKLSRIFATLFSVSAMISSLSKISMLLKCKDTLSRLICCFSIGNSMHSWQ